MAKSIDIEVITSSNLSESSEIEFEEFYIEDNRLLTMEVRGG